MRPEKLVRSLLYSLIQSGKSEASGSPDSFIYTPKDYPSHQPSP
ncbi:hypothetical protein [Xenorhabdus bovienii]|nr:hypothetical protein [Xenorhabdus bovienii]